MPVLIDEKIDKLLETTSRSFYPTLKYLPKKTRGQIGLLYLLARVADTIADTKVGETALLLEHLKIYNDVLQGRGGELPDFSELAALQTNEHEAELRPRVRTTTTHATRKQHATNGSSPARHASRDGSRN
jgi:phytoene/squalene synthetase